MNQPISRRSLLIGATTVLAAATPLALAGCSTVASRDPESTRGEINFNNELTIPPLAESSQTPDGHRSFNLTPRSSKTEFIPGRDTTTFGYNGSYLGPTIRAQRGETVAIHVQNDLSEATTVHWHGMKLPAAMDGGPHQTIHPGDSWTATWTINQPAATAWYHPHPHGRTEAQVNMGLAGIFIIDDDTETGTRLPHNYGVDDIPVVVQDRMFSSSGEFTTRERAVTGYVGDTILVNGTLAPYFTATTETLRLRLLNGSSARTYNFAFSDGREFSLVATDSGYVAGAIQLSSIILSPGERAEIIVRLSPSDSCVLQSLPYDSRMSFTHANAAGANDSLDILQIRAADHLLPGSTLPSLLAAAEDALLTDANSATARKRFELSGHLINAKSMDMTRIDEVVAAGAVELWEIRNIHVQAHNFHVHNARFTVLSVDNEPPPPHLAGWKDTVFLPAGTSVRCLITFGPYPDPYLPYMYHCHLLWHEDMGMMGQYTVVAPDEVSSAPRKITAPPGAGATGHHPGMSH
ncbi:multicopper oxidase domain-containing protein [Lysinibacter sp. HNR]|uniref:multicopper oxidase family protein n=1 Tax=Lysinibacter sp. HNR TaxID=3031408 RepID=UPI002435DE5A|nr:multicopper oxidase domain-containing protein [Lysinibacter sp. HNR]WGD36504.1 multicopper oxidase domain-containing protein [Lysinibacter sp. HNR]